MSRIDLLKTNYQRLCKMEWDHNVSGSQRVWLAVYDKEDERKLRFRLGLFEEATQHSGHKWCAMGAIPFCHPVLGVLRRLLWGEGRGWWRRVGRDRVSWGGGISFREDPFRKEAIVMGDCHVDERNSPPVGCGRLRFDGEDMTG